MKVSAEVLRYLELRGIKDPQAQRRFLFPRLEDHHDPFALAGMEEAVALLAEAVKHRRRMLVWGDADLDGIASTAMLKSVLEDLGAQDVEFHIPVRDREGFGLDSERLREFRESGGEVVVTVDVGVSNAVEAAAARELGLELVITDHHEIVTTMPDAVVVNPKREGCSYPWRELSGSGVALKLASALYGRVVGLSVEELAGLRPHCWMFAALGTVADRCPLLDENRLIVSYGLARLREGGWRSLEIWLEETGLDAANLTVFDIYSRGISSFYAADPQEVVELLLSTDEERLRTRYHRLKELAAAWQRGKQHMIAEAERSVRYLGEIAVSVSQTIDSAYLGTVAHALREHHGKPAIVLVPYRDTWRAECRGLECTDLLGHLTRFEELFLTFGGHRKACGFTLKPQALDEFLAALERHPIDIPGTPEETNGDVPAFELELSADLKDWSLLAPFGEGNPPPRLRARGVKLQESSGGFQADGVPVYLPLSLRPLPRSNGRFDMDYTVNPDGGVRVLALTPID